MEALGVSDSSAKKNIEGTKRTSPVGHAALVMGVGASVALTLALTLA